MATVEESGLLDIQGTETIPLSYPHIHSALGLNSGIVPMLGKSLE